MSVSNNFPSVAIGAHKSFEKCDLAMKYTIDMTVEELCQTFKFTKIITKTI